GLLGRDKHVPAAYRRASLEQRLALVQGLMDTDGSITPNGSCELSLCNQMLATDALEVIRSLGIKASMNTGPAAITETDPGTGEKPRRQVGTRWRIHFTTTQPVFRLPSKKCRLPESDGRVTNGWNYIVNIERTHDAAGRCLRVDDPEHLYLVE